MASDPFAEPSDTEGTVFRPRPSGAASPAPAPAVDRSAPVGPRFVPKVGSSPLVAAAGPVLAAALRIANDRVQPSDPERLRNAMVKAIRTFETDALATGLDTRTLRAARYALCATIDDLVLSTPWGMQSSWVQHSLVSVFHGEVIGGDRFFEIMTKMQEDLGHNGPVVELMYLCTSLGFEGRYRVMERGTAALAELRDGVYRLLRQTKGDFERELSPHWRGIAAGARSLATSFPLWARALTTFVIASIMYTVFNFILAGVSDASYAELSSLPPDQAMPVRRAQLPPVAQPAATPTAAPAAPAPAPAAPPPSSFSMRLRQFLAPEIRQGLVVVLEDAQTVTIRLTNRNMFASGEALLGPTYPALLVRIGDALETEPGQVTVNGYTDNQAIRTARFPSNFELSQARADTVAAALRARLKDPARLKAQGKGERDPIAPNATPDGRQQNRRTEIVLTRPSDSL
jgi:type VI secretion system protein ImpK